MVSTRDFAFKQIVFVFQDDGDCVSFRNDNLVVRNANDEIKLQTTCYRLFAVFICGHFTLTSGIIERSRKFGFSIVLMSHSLKVSAIIPARSDGNVLLKRKQYGYQGFEIGAMIESNKVHNQMCCLQSIRKKDSDILDTIDTLNRNKLAILNKELDLKQILGIEGTSAKSYFGRMFRSHNWTARRPRVKHDTVNCLMDIGYTLLFNVINGIAELFGFDTYVGVLHREFYNRKSLICDLVEPFRIIVDSSILKMLNLGQVHTKDFYYSMGQYSLIGRNSAKYVGIMLNEILDYKNEIFLYIQNYYRNFVQEKRIEDFPFFDYKNRKIVKFSEAYIGV